MRKQSGNIFKQQIRRPLGLSQTGNLKEESASGILEAPSAASLRKCLAGEASAEQVKVWEVVWIDLSGVRIISFLLSGVVDGSVAGVGKFVDLTVSNTLETACPVKTGSEAADAGEHIKVSDQ